MPDPEDGETEVQANEFAGFLRRHGLFQTPPGADDVPDEDDLSPFREEALKEEERHYYEDNYGDSWGCPESGNKPFPFPKEELMRYRGYDHPVNLRAPEHHELPTWLDPEYVTSWKNFGRFGEDRNSEAFISDFERRFTDKMVRPARMRESGDDLVVDCGIHRGRKPTSKQVGEGIYRHGLKYPGWTAGHFSRRFHPRYVAPFFKENDPEDKSPFDWAYRRVQVASGVLAASGWTHDFPASCSEYPYMQMASKVMNTADLALKPSRTIHMDAGKRALRSAADEVLGKKNSPEAIWFLLKNSGSIKPEMLTDPDSVKYLGKLPRCFENGLVIDRLYEFYRDCITRGSSPEHALRFCLQVVTDVYGGSNRPWWFKEKINFISLFDLTAHESGAVGGKFKVAYDERGKNLVGLIAKVGDFAFEYSLAAYKEKGHELEAVEKIGCARAVTFCCAVVRNYGIGNTSRAANVIKLAVGLLKNIPPERRMKSLRSIERMAHEQRPTNEIRAKLEGEDAGFHMPGMTAIFMTFLGEKRAEREKADDMTVSTEMLEGLRGPLSAPFLRRARALPAVTIPFDRRLLLTAPSASDRLALPPHSPLALAGPAEGIDPVSGIIDFYDRLREECGMDSSVASNYFALFASKMPNPFAPPKGFLAFLRRYMDLRLDDDAPNPIMFYPGYERDHAAAECKDQSLQRLMHVRDLLDAWILGAMSIEDVMLILNWVAQSPTSNMFKSSEARVKRQDRKHQGDAETQAERRGWDVKNGADDLMRRCIKKRLGQFRALVFFLNLMRFMISEEILDPSCICLSDAGDFTRKAGKLNLEEALPKGKFDITTLVGSMHAMCGNGLFDADGFGAALRDAKTTDAKLATIGHLFKAMGFLANFEGSLQREEEEIRTGLRGVVSSSVTDSGAADRFFAMLREVEERLQQRLVEISGGVPWIKAEAVAPFFESRFAHDRDNIVTAAVAAFRRKLALSAPGQKPADNAIVPYWSSGRYQERDKKGAVAEITQSTLTMLSVALASQGQDLLVNVRKQPDGADVDKRIVVGNGVSAGFRLPVAIGSVRRLLDDVVPVAKEFILKSRRETIGLLPVGGKIHVLHPIDSRKFRRFLDTFGFSNTSFQLIHANNSMLLPPTLSDGELEAMIAALSSANVIDDEHPELQLGGSGRLDPPEVAILATCVLLATERGVRYNADAFKTSHDETGMRMMAYDANGPRVELPFMTPLIGRTDMLGRRTAKDGRIFRPVHSVLAHEKAKGQFAKFAGPLKSGMRAILQKYGLEHVLNNNWIFAEEAMRMERGSERHYEDIQACTDAYFKCADRHAVTGREEGIIFDVRNLLDNMRAEISQEQERLYLSGTPCDDVKMVLNL